MQIGTPKRRWDVSLDPHSCKQLYLPSQVAGSFSLNSLESVIREDLQRVVDRAAREFGMFALGLLMRRLRSLSPVPDIFNGKMLSVIGISSSKIELTLTSYHSFLLTNYLADETDWQAGVDHYWPRRFENSETPLSDSIRANPLSVHLNLITKTADDYYLLVSRRSDTTANAPSVYGHTAGGSMDISDVYDYGGEAIERTAIRELKEELGIDLTPQDLSVVDIFVSSKVLDPVAVVVAIVPAQQSMEWTTNSEIQSATWRRIADVQQDVQLRPQDWHYDTLDDIATTANFLNRDILPALKDEAS